MRRVKATSALVAVFLTLGATVCMAQRYTDLYIGWLRCDRIKGPQANSTIYIDNVVSFASNVTFSSTVTGDITCDDITANGGESATLDINMPTTQATNTITTKLGIVADASVTYLDWILSGTNMNTQTVSYASERFLVTDSTDTTEDLTRSFYVYVAGASTEVLTLGATANVTASKLTVTGTLDVNGLMTATNITLDAGAKLIGTTSLTLGSGSETVSIDSSDWDIGTTGDMSGIGAITANGAVDFQSTLDVDGAMTCTNVTMDSGSTLAAYTVTVATSLDVNAPMTATNITTDAGSALSVGGTADFNGVVTSTNITMDTGSTLAAATLTVATSLDVNGAMTCTNVTVDSGSTVTLTGATVTGGTITNATVHSCTITNATYGGNQSFAAGTITGGTITNATAVWASSFGIPGFAGYTGVVTNTAPADAATNVMFYCGGIVTNVVKTP